MKRAAFGRPSLLSVWKRRAPSILRVMRRLFLAAGLLVGLIAMPAGAGARAKPSIIVTRVVPLTVRGTGFVARERVIVTARVYDSYRKSVTATRRGGFLLAYRIGVSKCVTIHVVARGNRGSRATTIVPATCAP